MNTPAVAAAGDYSFKFKNDKLGFRKDCVCVAQLHGLLYERFINSISTLFIQKVLNGRNYGCSHYEVLHAALQTPQLLLENIVPALALDLNVQDSKNMEKKKILM